jgi:tetratricopeptide (TPR) repeat protein
MIRRTRQKRTSSAPRQRKTSSGRRSTDSRSASTRRKESRAGHRVKAKAGRKAVSKPVQQPRDPDRETALKNFETAIGFFQRRNYEKAAGLFQKVAASPVSEMADRARVHLRFCERKRHHEKRPKTAEGYYARGVAALNGRDFDRAIEYLNKSDKMAPNKEHIHYALAAVYGLRGDSDNAFDHLEAAIRLRPQNRIQARSDEDFEALADDPRFSRLLGTDSQQSLT